MRILRETASFKRDLKRIKKSGMDCIDDIERAAALLLADSPLPEHMRDHVLSGAWKKLQARECHVNPDLLLRRRLMTTTVKAGRRARPEISFIVVDGDLRLKMHKGPSGMYVASSLDVSGLFTQGRTVEETIANARDAAKALAESRAAVAGETARSAKKIGTSGPGKAARMAVGGA